MELLAKRTTRPELLRVLEDFRAAVGDQFEGLVEGAATSPIMLACLLSEGVVPSLRQLGKLWIWGDDGLLLVRDERTAHAARRALDAELAKLGLETSPGKTGVYEIANTWTHPKWSYIGFAFRGDQPEPGQAEIAALLQNVYTSVHTTEVAELLRGWALHFGRVCNDPTVYAAIDDKIQAINSKYPRRVDLVKREPADTLPSDQPRKRSKEGSRDGQIEPLPPYRNSNYPLGQIFPPSLIHYSGPRFESTGEGGAQKSCSLPSSGSLENSGDGITGLVTFAVPPDVQLAIDEVMAVDGLSRSRALATIVREWRQFVESPLHGKVTNNE